MTDDEQLGQNYYLWMSRGFGQQRYGWANMSEAQRDLWIERAKKQAVREKEKEN